MMRFLAALVLAAALPCSAQAEPTDAEIDQGRQIYDDFCATCHGRDLVNPGGVTFDLRKFPKDDFERFRNSVLNGKPPAMPPWRDKVGDDDVKLLGPMCAAAADSIGPALIGIAWCGEHAVRVFDATKRDLQPLRFVLHAHPAQLANAFDKLAR